MEYPAEYKYTKDHEWLQVEGKTALVGLTDFAQKQLGDIVFVEVVSKEGAQLEAEEPFGSVESVKAVSEFFSPVSGKVVAVNALLDAEPDAINTDPHGSWIIKIEMSGAKQLDGLLTAAQYEQFITAED
ncbi:glycine cleavage system protein GcvH [Kitasatospora sp. Root107]|uniref:glycine cleavage system protein GcvH n=1 Tax=Kitasatospora sp. Root107 TaxID=1736424 RepID=UPI00070FD000|nr:glycine cleavage system protein GcvH [Kitasatospora sp. Root107]KQV11926.1 glycine cleavage system protein H [Kitasatospora sp. Root107]